MHACPTPLPVGCVSVAPETLALCLLLAADSVLFLFLQQFNCGASMLINYWCALIKLVPNSAGRQADRPSALVQAAPGPNKQAPQQTQRVQPRYPPPSLTMQRHPGLAPLVALLLLAVVPGWAFLLPIQQRAGAPLR